MAAAPDARERFTRRHPELAQYARKLTWCAHGYPLSVCPDGQTAERRRWLDDVYRLAYDYIAENGGERDDAERFAAWATPYEPPSFQDAYLAWKLLRDEGVVA